MAKTTHAELVLQALRYASETLAEGDLHAVLDLGFRIEQVARLQALTLGDLQHLSRVRAHFLDIRVDPLCFDRVLEHMERSKRAEALQDELIRLRAPLPMMRAFFGMTNAEYAARRKLLGMSGAGVGRPPAPSEEEERRLWDAWQEAEKLAIEERYLAVGRATGVPLSIIWALTRAWEEAGLTGFHAAPARANTEVVALPSERGE
jgi:Protein of unknown function (DUF2857)